MIRVSAPCRLGVYSVATFIVTNAADSGAGSLRDAIAQSNAHSGADTITFDQAVFDGEAADTIRLTSGQLVVTGALTIDGGPNGVLITGDANGDDVVDAAGVTDVDASLAGEDRLDDNTRILDASAALTLKNLILTGGRTTADREMGGAVRAALTLDLTKVLVAGNSTTGTYSYGGGIAATGAVTLTDSTVADNRTTGYGANGGGVFSATIGATIGGSVTALRSTVSGNRAEGVYGRGGGIATGIETGGVVTLTDSTVSGNRTTGEGGHGGGIVGTALTLTNTTLWGNAAEGPLASGGGARAAGTITATNATVLGNTATDSDSGAFHAGGELRLTDSILALNGAVSGSLVLAGSNLLPSDTVPNLTLFQGTTPAGEFLLGDVFAALDAGIPVLADNGGPVWTVALLPDAANPAIDAATGGTVAADARGKPGYDLPGAGAAGSGATVRDLGAFEASPPLEAPSLVVTTAADIVDPYDGLTSLREAVALANARAGADTVSFDQTVFNGEVADRIRLTAGQIVITEALTIDGGPNRVQINGDRNGDDVVDAQGITDVTASLAGEDRLDDNSRIFDATAALALRDLTLTGGRTTAGSEAGGAVRVAGALDLAEMLIAGNSTAGQGSIGGGVTSTGTMTLTDSTVAGNHTFGADAVGGGIAAGRPLQGLPPDVTVTRSTISGNSTSGTMAFGGGIATAGFNRPGGDLWLIDSTVSDNRTTGGLAHGGGIFTAGSFSLSEGTLSLTNSTVSGNEAVGGKGGGIFGGDMTLTNTTIFGNTAAPSYTTVRDAGGGIYSTRGVTVTNGTIVANATGSGSSEAIEARFGIRLTDSIVAQNGIDGNQFGAYVVLTGRNLLSGSVPNPYGPPGATTSGVVLYDGSQRVAEATPDEVFVMGILRGVPRPLLADNGGPVKTVALKGLPSNPAIDAGTDATAPDARGIAAFDQPLVPGTGRRDVGAFELDRVIEAPSLVVTTAQDVVDGTDGVTSLREAIALANRTPGADRVTFDPGVFDGEARDVIRLTQGEMRIREDLVIDGGPAGVTITGDAKGDDVTLAGGITDVDASLLGDNRLDDNSQIFRGYGAYIPGYGERPVALDIHRLTLTGGVAPNTGSEFNQGGALGGQYLTVTGSGNMIAGNMAGFAGGIAAAGVTLSDSAIWGNRGETGGIVATGQTTLTNSAVWGNVGSNRGGISSTYVTLIDSTVSGNVARYRGGGIIGNHVTLIGSTVSGNAVVGPTFGYSPLGGGIVVTRSLEATNSILLGNTVTTAGGQGREYFLYQVGPTPPSLTLSGNNIIGDGAGGATIFHASTATGTTTAAAVFEGTLALSDGTMAGTLGENGGPTPTIALRADPANPAIGGADPATAAATDQRGVARDARPDLGAFEVVNAPPGITDDTATTGRDMPIVVDPLGNDADPLGGIDPTSVRLVGADAGSDGRVLTGVGVGRWVVDPASGSVTFTPAPGFQGQATALYVVADGFGAVSLPAAIRIDVATGATGTATDGRDRLLGTAYADSMDGLGGNDRLVGLDGADILKGGDGNDTVDAGAGADTVEGGAGDDLILIRGGIQARDDSIDGGAGTDTVRVVPGVAAVTLAGMDWAGVEAFDGSGAVVAGTAAGDVLDLGRFASVTGVAALNGRDGDDTLTGGAGTDSILGGRGVDEITGGPGNDTMAGGAGFDRFVFGPGFGQDVIRDFDARPNGGQDLLVLQGYATPPEVLFEVIGGDTRVTIGTDGVLLVGVTGIGANAVSMADVVVAPDTVL